MEDIRKEFIDGASLNQFADKRDVHHFDGEPLTGDDEVGEGDFAAFSDGALAGEGVEGCVDDGVAPVIFLQDFAYNFGDVSHSNHF